MSDYKVLRHDVETGETIEETLSQKEIDFIKKEEERFLAQDQKRDEVKASALAKLSALGLTEAEAQAFLS